MGKFSGRTSVKIQPSGRSRNTGGRVMIYFQLPLELNKRRLLLENLQRDTDTRGFSIQQIPELRAI